MDDTHWAPGSEGNLMLGLDGGQYSPYLTTVVEEVQRFLFEQDLYDGPVTGVLDVDTMNALGEFQEQNGLAKSGVPSPNTREAMQESESP